MINGRKAEQSLASHLVARASGPLLSADVTVAKLEAWVATPSEALLGKGQKPTSQTHCLNLSPITSPANPDRWPSCGRGTEIAPLSGVTVRKEGGAQSSVSTGACFLLFFFLFPSSRPPLSSFFQTNLLPQGASHISHNNPVRWV